MANYISQVITPRVPSNFIKRCTAPAGGITAGSYVIVDTLDNTISGNISVFTAGATTAENIKGKNIGIVLSGGFETLADGRRPDGQPNYYSYTYQAGETVDVAIIGEGLAFNIGLDCITTATVGAATVGAFVYPVAATAQPTAGATVPADTNGAMKIVALYNTPIGGNYGAGFASSLICIAV